MNKEQEQEIIRREEIKERAIEYGEAKRIYESFEKANDYIAQPIMESKTHKVGALARTNKYTTNFLNAFNQVKRDARNIYIRNVEGFLDNGVTKEELKKYENLNFSQDPQK